MSFLIAVTGKGGVGKTTVSAMLIKQLIKSGKIPVLAIDADPNSCLDAYLGVHAEHTVGRAREEVRQEVQAQSGVSKHELLNLKISESLVESSGFDLIAMGRPEGAGCYCYANNVLKSVIAELSSSYPFVVLDNEAGLENLSRRIVQKVDVLALVSDAGGAGLETLARLHELAVEMGIEYSKLVLIVNRLRSDRLPDKVAEVQKRTGADLVVGLPDDLEVADFAEHNRSLLELSDDNTVLTKIDSLIQDLI